MTSVNDSEIIENKIFDGGIKNYVVPTQQSTMATEEPSGTNTHNKDLCVIMDRCCASGVSALSLNEPATAAVQVAAAAAAGTAAATIAITQHNQHNNNQHQQQQQQQQPQPNVNKTNEFKNNATVKNIVMKSKRRRRKSSKQKSNTKPYKKTNWKFQVIRSRNSSGGNGSGCVGGSGSGAGIIGGSGGGRSTGRRGDNNGIGSLSTLVPYNTNKFLMEEHMPELTSVRNRDSSFSVDSDENVYNDDEFLSKEFSSVYENARTERLEGMSKQQLIQEYLQLEANYDKLSKNLGAKKCYFDNAKEVQQAKNFECQNIIRKLEERVKELSAENLGKSSTLNGSW